MPVAPSVPPLPADQVTSAGETDQAPAEEQWRPVVTGFAQDFTRAGSGTADWAGRLSRWTTPQLADKYQTVDARQIPTGTLLDVTPDTIGTFSLTFTIRYDSGLILRGQATLGPAGWQVNAIEKDTEGG